MKHKSGHAVWVERGVHAEVKEELEIEAVCTGVRGTTQQKAAEGTPFCHAGRDVELRRSAGANRSVGFRLVEAAAAACQQQQASGVDVARQV